MRKRATINDMVSAATMVMASALKKPPVTPEMKASGRNTTIVAPVEPKSGFPISAAAASSPGGSFAAPSCMRRIICSSMTTASSMMRPTAAAMPPSVIMSKCMPSANRTRQVPASTAGSTTAVIAISRTERRKTKSTSPASTAPNRIASRTALAAPLTSSDWS